MNRYSTGIFSLLVMASFCIGGNVLAGVIDPDCTPEKAMKSTAAKATVGVSGRCSPAEAAKDTATKSVGNALPDDGVAGKAVDMATPDKDQSALKKAGKAVIN
ncbi:hypothetical protein [Photobacterium frigidiphilum]|uniref:hypothetical protein n=1 Tax=Photobacterium frigidiphilum TaxID=264736 RepID=UPI003FA77D1D